MKLLASMQKVPAGTLNVPMAITAVIHTFFPSALNIGGTTTALFATGTTTLIGVMLFLTGTQFKLNQVAPTFKRGFVLLVAKLLIGIIGSLIVVHYLAPQGIWGMSTIALVAALTATNPGIYLAICGKQGDGIDTAAFGLLNLISVPAIGVFCMGLGAGGGFQPMILVQVLVPFLVGMLVGNLDDDLSTFLRPGSAIVLPFLGFCFGSAIDLKLVVSAGMSGLVLTAFYLVVNVPILLAVDRFILRRPGYAAMGVASAAGVSTAVPPLYAAIDPSFAPYVSVSVAQIAMIVVITSFLMPVVAGWFRKMPEKEPGHAAAVHP
ncbi:2-keto-3-deoxygluconate permease [Martelella sp. HB161492]|uniref:2-keto-3-deoxygluconate permease n=1 Tax=Martelella sp. HB161492 TaxID=2720726 RepID=UPI0015928665|nr:2-keto-3-deoxygluconate permease [Martelella sp. HB161492]